MSLPGGMVTLNARTGNKQWKARVVRSGVRQVRENTHQAVSASTEMGLFRTTLYTMDTAVRMVSN